MTTRAEALEILTLAGTQPDDALDVGGTALALGLLDQPGADLPAYRAHLAMLARDMADRHAAAIETGTDGLNSRIATLRAVLADRHGYAGDHDTYDDLQNANLLRVIDRRRGLPVALGILYLHAARAMGWDMAGLNFPGHFLLRLDHEGQRAIIDPFNGATTRTAADLRELLKATGGAGAELRPEHYAAVGARDVLLRLQNNLKLRHLTAGDVPRALDTLAGMVLFAPDEAGLWRETGLLEAHAGHNAQAIAALERFIALSDSPPQKHQAALLIQQLRPRPH